MKKKAKQILALLLCLTMCVSVASPALAAYYAAGTVVDEDDYIAAGTVVEVDETEAEEPTIIADNTDPIYTAGTVVDEDNYIAAGTVVEVDDEEDVQSWKTKIYMVDRTLYTD